MNSVWKYRQYELYVNKLTKQLSLLTCIYIYILDLYLIEYSCIIEASYILYLFPIVLKTLTLE